jgi:hypothetical protein
VPINGAEAGLLGLNGTGKASGAGAYYQEVEDFVLRYPSFRSWIGHGSSLGHATDLGVWKGFVGLVEARW